MDVDSEIATDTGPPARRPVTVHVVCFEEAGECTLERIAREAAPGDRVLVLGPERFALRLREFGLHDDVAVESIGRRAGRGYGEALRSGGAPRRRSASRDTDPRTGGRTICYGRRALVEVPEGHSVAVPDSLPAAPAVTPERRARIRRELGLGAGEFALLVAGDPAEWIDLSFASRACTMARVAGAPVRMVASPRSARIAEASGFFEQTAHGKPIVVDPRAERPWELLPALDGSLLDADGVGEQPVLCRGWRVGGAVIPQPMSPLPALWSLAFGKPAAVHRAIDLGMHAAHPGVARFGDDVAELARAIHAFANSASAASR